jgi:RNA polymerase sigma factor (TIGR02999 family)
MREVLPSGITELLQAWNRGDEDALRQLIPLVYQDLKRLARRNLARRSQEHTLQATALVHEAYIRLASKCEVHWEDRVHFFAVMARMIRGILVDHARARTADKRGGGALTLTLDQTVAIANHGGIELLDLDNALTRLGDIDPQQSRVVELRFFAGLSIDETAEALGISPATVKRDWAFAKTWIQREIYGVPCDA